VDAVDDRILREVEQPVVPPTKALGQVAAHLLKRMQRSADAEAAYSRAIGLCEDPAIREFLIQQARQAC